jgi:hypothetical protein
MDTDSLETCFLNLLKLIILKVRKVLMALSTIVQHYYSVTLPATMPQLLSFTETAIS